MATLVERYQAEVTIGGNVHKVNHTKSTLLVTDIFDRVIGVTSTNFQTLLNIGTDAGATMTALDWLYIENLDATNFATIGFAVSGADAVFEKLVPGGKIVKHSRGFDALQAFVLGDVPSLTDFTSIIAKADTAEVSLRVVALD